MKSAYLSVLICLVSLFVFTQCQKEKFTKNESATRNTIALVVDAANFVKTLEYDGLEFTGIFVKLHNGELLFNKVLVEDNLFKSKEIDNVPSFSKIVIAENGEILPFNGEMIEELNTDFLSGNFDLTYFNWTDLKILARNSEKLYFSKSELIYGSSIYQSSSSSAQKKYPNLKIEGDFNKMQPSDDEPSLTPMYLIGMPCPPYWKEE